MVNANWAAGADRDRLVTTEGKVASGIASVGIVRVACVEWGTAETSLAAYRENARQPAISDVNEPNVKAKAITP